MFHIILMTMIAPATLTCTLDLDGRPAVLTLRLDEAHGGVRYAWPATAPAVTARAVFTQDQVMFDSFTLDRTSLAIARDGDAVTAALGAQPRTARGRCRTAGVRPVSKVPAKPAAISGNRRK